MPEPSAGAPDMSRVIRLARHGVVSSALAPLGDRRLAELVEAAPCLGSGVGGATALLEVEGRPVFVKRVPLTDLERRPENIRSTANLFGLPAFCHYGLGLGSGFGAWRELAAHVLTTGWVLGGHYEGFPLLHHWRVLPGPAAGEGAELEEAVAYWESSPAVRARLESVASASAAVVLFLEYIPHDVSRWLEAQAALGDDAAGAACSLLDRELAAGVRFMNANGLLHFDAHFGNILTDGRRLYFTDFGLAAAPGFECSAAERAFLRLNAGHDESYAARELVNRVLVTLSRPPGRAELLELVRQGACGGDLPGVPEPVAEVVRRHAPVAAVMNDFYGKLFDETRTAPYPAAAIHHARSFLSL
ncbi:serine/threonine protein phosphatase [Sphaerisporangium dianthi]|uniref:Serine/threonine protein phosphatase n=1 Tax=Sphaerisporangium dianthi TaxID=1436120 RepID=A0ABV9CI69_9ACTN